MWVDDLVRKEEGLTGFTIWLMMWVEKDTLDTEPRKRGQGDWYFIRVHLASSDLAASQTKIKMTICDKIDLYTNRSRIFVST